MRTTDQEHKKTVQHFWNILETGGHFHYGEYSGWYCTSDEQFLGEEDIIFPSNPKEKPRSKFSGKEVEKTSESNILFKLGDQKKKLLDWIHNEDVIIPNQIRNQVEQTLQKSNHSTLSVTRDSNRVSWGIPSPNDSNQTIYVWLDALTNYLTSVGYPNPTFSSNWPPDYQIMGKDIATFHCVYW